MFGSNLLMIDELSTEIVVGKPYNVKFFVDIQDEVDGIDVKYKYVSFDSEEDFLFNGEGEEHWDVVVGWVEDVMNNEDVEVILNGEVVIDKGV